MKAIKLAAAAVVVLASAGALPGGQEERFTVNVRGTVPPGARLPVSGFVTATDPSSTKPSTSGANG